MSLLAAVVLCAGAFLCFLPTEVYASTDLRPAHPSHPLDRGADQGYLAVAQEGWEADKDPVNADLLTTLALGVYFFLGLSFGWVLTNTQKRGAMCSVGVVGPSVAIACEELPFLEVYRL